jgi:hypothetical protein
MSDGSRHSMAQVVEAVYGTTPATPAFKAIRHTGTSLGLSKESIQSEELRSDRMITDMRMGARQVGGDIEFELSYGSFADQLEAVLMGTWAVGVPAVGTDRLKAGVVRRSFTIERLFGDMAAVDEPYHRYTGCEYNSMELSINANAMVTGKFGLMGRDLATAQTALAGATYPAATTTSPFDSFTGSLKEGGAVIAVITEISLKLDNGFDPRYVVGDKRTIKPSVKRSNVNGSITAYFETNALMKKFIDETESSIDFDLTDGAGNTLRFWMPRIKYTGGQPDVKGEGPVTLSMPFQALLDATTGSNLVIDRTPA